MTTYIYCLVFTLLINTIWSRIHIVEVYVGDHPVIGYYAIKPTVDVTFTQLERSYPHLAGNYTRSVIREAGSYSCSEAVDIADTIAGQIMTTLDKLNGFKVLLSPGRILSVAIFLNKEVKV